MAKKKGFFQTWAEAEREKQKRLRIQANQSARQEEREFREEERRREMANRRYCPKCRRILIQDDYGRYYCEYCHEYPSI